MENYIVINGKKAELTEEQLKKLGIEIKKQNISELFDKHSADGIYFFIDSCGTVKESYPHVDICTCSSYSYASMESYHDLAMDRYEVANYCQDKKIMVQRALHETLNRLLWRFSMRNGGDEINWRNKEQDKFYIFWDYENNGFDIGIDDICKGIEQYFVSEEVAIQAIDKIIKPFMEEHPEFVW